MASPRFAIETRLDQLERNFATTFRGIRSPLRGLPCSQLDNSAAQGDRHRLRAIAGTQLFHDVLDVNFDRLLRDEEFFPNVSIALSVGGIAQYLQRSRRQVFVT